MNRVGVDTGASFGRDGRTSRRTFLKAGGLVGAALFGSAAPAGCGVGALPSYTAPDDAGGTEIVGGAEGGPNLEAIAAPEKWMTGNPLWRSLKAVRDDRAFAVGGDARLFSNARAADLVLDDLEKHL